MTTLAPSPSPAAEPAPCAAPRGGTAATAVDGLPRAADVLVALRPSAAGFSPGPGAFTGTLLALVSLGVAPAVLWALRFQAVAAADRRALRKVAGWAAGRVGADRAAALTAAADRVGPFGFLPALVAVYAVAAVGAVALVARHVPFAAESWSSLLGLTYGAQWSRLLPAMPSTGGHMAGFVAWSIAVAGAYLAHLLQVHLHARAVRRFLDLYNQAVPLEEGYRPVLLDPIGFGFAPVWMAAAAVLCAASGWWGVAFAAAGATDRRYRKRAIRGLRTNLADSVRDVVLARPEFRRPDPPRALRHADPEAPDVARCPTPGCGRAFGAGVKFCPRCGQRVGGSVDRQA